MQNANRCCWRNVWLRRSVIALVILTLLFILVGFIWLPAVSGDAGTQGLWARICGAAGAPLASGTPVNYRGGQPSTNFILERSMASLGSSESVGSGATLALNCTMCHGVQGLSSSDVPNLAGQYPETTIKQLNDYKSRMRPSAIMQALAQNLSNQNIADLADYFASLPKAMARTGTREGSPALVQVGAPLRNIAPCSSCHGILDHKLGAPWLEGMPKTYLVAQLTNFQAGVRHNDSHAQMRNMVRKMSSIEIDEVAQFYSRSGR